MCNLRKAMAILLVLVFSLSFAVSASAAGAGSPPNAPTPTPTPAPTAEPEWDRHIYTPADKTDTYFPLSGNVIGYDITDEGAALINVIAPKANGHVTADEAKDGNKKLVSITQIGSSTGSYGIGQVRNGMKQGQNVTALTVVSDQKVTIVANAFKKTRIKTIALGTDRIAIKANAFKGSTAKTIVINALNVATCDNLQLNKKAFNGLKKVTIKVSKTTMSNAEYKKLKAKMKKKYGKNFGKSVVLKRV